ncbi:MAG TPA: hypothetical protein VGA61_08540 [Anaerolineae bacterium]
MIQRKSQTPEYWQDFALTGDDVAFLRNLLQDSEEPLTTEQLAAALVGDRMRREENEIKAELSRGALYMPKNSYALGDKILFPALDFRLGTVTALRPGQNPEYGSFDVITVDFGPDRRQRHFAAGLAAPHKLNQDPTKMLENDDAAAADDLLTTVASGVPERLASGLAQEPGFATFEDRWLLRDLLAEVHVGHLNIAEALIEMRGQPVETGVLLRELDLPGEVNPEALAFSLQSALAADERFDQVGPGDTRRWFLRRLEAAEAVTTPNILRYQPVPYDRGAMTVELLQLEWELDDEWGEESAASQASRVAMPSTSLLLTYPHLASGTLPLASRNRAFFPSGHGKRVMITFIDGRWGQRFPGYVVPSERYVGGLSAWYDQHKLPAGAFIVLERREDPLEIVVDFRPRRMKREWMRMAEVADGERLDFQMRKQAVACEYDEQVILGVEQGEAIAQLQHKPEYAEAPMPGLMFQIFADLAGLSQQGSVHAKTLYSAINVVRRSPPGPIFAALAADRRVRSIGDGFYRLAGD